MAAFLIGLLTLIMVLDCLILILLVLIQLPKKEAGAGMAFGGAATDALFGAGSGTVLTKITKYAAGGFFLLALVLSILQTNYHRRTSTEFQKKLDQAGPVTLPMAAPPTNASVFASNNAFVAPTPEATTPTTPAIVPAGTNLPQAAPLAPK